jgi:hypothetical protein
VRAHFDSACSLLRHEGIPFDLRETRAGLVPYVTQDDLLIFVPAVYADEARELMELLEQPSHPAYRPFRELGGEMLEGEDDEEGGETAASDADDDELPSGRDRARGALVMLTLCTFAVVAVTIGLALAQREQMAGSMPRMTSPSARLGASAAHSLEGR